VVIDCARATANVAKQIAPAKANAKTPLIDMTPTFFWIPVLPMRTRLKLGSPCRARIHRISFQRAPRSDNYLFGWRSEVY
jgi:hypothetical protein